MRITQFDENYYYTHRPDVQAAITNGTFEGTAEDHYNWSGWRELSDPNDYFSTFYYLAANPDVLAARVNPFQHFIEYGIHEGRGANVESDFISIFYFAERPDVLSAIVNGTFNGTARDHYNAHGWREGSDPNPLFDTSYYLGTYSDVRDAGINPFQHYLQYGMGENRSTNGDGGGNGGGTPVTVSVAQAGQLAQGTPYHLADSHTAVAAASTASPNLLTSALSVTANGTEQADTIDLGGLSVNLTINGLGESDTITGGQGNNTINGGAGFDYLVGGAGNDTLVGGSEGDTLVGRAGADTINLTGGGNDRVEYSADTDAGTAGQLAQNQGDAITGFTSAAGDAAEVDDIRLFGSFLTEAMTGTSANAVTAVNHGAGINLGGAGSGTNSVLLVAAGTNTAATGDLFTLGDLNSAIGALTGESAGAERILAFNSTDGNAVLYKYTSSATPDSALTADELQVLGTFDENLAVGDFIFA